MGFEHELIIPNEGFPFKLFQFEGKDGHYVREKHWHRSIEIFAVFEGTLAFFINEEEYPLGSGEFILLNSNEIHSISSPEANRTIVLQIPMNVLRNVETGEGLILFTHSPEEIRHYRKLNRLSTITDYIRENYTKELSLEMVADRFGYSPSYLSRMFRKYAQTNYKTYLQNVRIEYGFQELANTDHTIGEIALNNGFPNQKAFTREFKKKYGILPSEYRRGQKNAKD